MAGEKRQAAKYAYLRHVEEHGCEKAAQEAVAEFAHHIQPPERRKRPDPARISSANLDLLPETSRTSSPNKLTAIGPICGTCETTQSRPSGDRGT